MKGGKEDSARKNIDYATVKGFGAEWSKFTQADSHDVELCKIFDAYFSIFPWGSLPPNSRGFDLGCGSGRWARFVAPRVGQLYCIDASQDALSVAKKNLGAFKNVEFLCCTVDEVPVDDGFFDFGYSLGVLHHVPNTLGAIRSCVQKLKRGAPLLLYLYYAFDNRPIWFQQLWKISDLLRSAIARLPFPVKLALSEMLAFTVYYPTAKLARIVEKIGRGNVENYPLAAYRDRSLYAMRTDCLDRFGTQLEQRFTAAKISHMMKDAGLTDIRFSNQLPFWCALGVRR